MLTSKEIGVIDRYYRVSLCRLQKLPPTTPDCVVFFLGGILPATALIHLRQLGLLGMIARMEETSPLQKLGRKVLLSNHKTRSWFVQLRDISEKYKLPDPLLILQSPPTKVFVRGR